MQSKRTDLALEAKELFEESAGKITQLQGVRARESERDGCHVTEVEVLDSRGSSALNKPVGRYITLTLALETESHLLESPVCCLAAELRRLLPPLAGKTVLVAGLGNRAITPDALGPLAAEQILPTRHLRDAPFAALTPVCVLAPGVLGTTGLESAEVVRSVAERVQASCVIVMDALVARRTERLCTTVQLSDTGIIPGSGIGNHRCALNEDTLHVPVLSVGVPMVIDARTLAADLLETEHPGMAEDLLNGLLPGMTVTVKDVDARVRTLSKVVAWGVNLAVQPLLSLEDLAALLA